LLQIFVFFHGLRSSDPRIHPRAMGSPVTRMKISASMLATGICNRK
jgi:hypothetical protein